MDWLLIGGLILFGLFLIIVEVFLIPGTTIFGIIGIILLTVGFYYTYENYGNTTGTIILVVSCLLTGGCLLLGLKAGVWKNNPANSTGTVSTLRNLMALLHLGASSCP